MLVIKFGGSSVASSQNIKRIKSILESKKEPYIVVVSALKGVTDQLTKLAKESSNKIKEHQLNELKTRHLDLCEELFDFYQKEEVFKKVNHVFNEISIQVNSVFHLNTDKKIAEIVGYGERLSSYIIYKFLIQSGIKINYLKSESCIIAEGDHLNALLDEKESYRLINSNIDNNQNYISAGFIASNKNNEIVLLGRGGSDYSASIYAGMIHANGVELWSDVNGMQTANPQFVKQAKPIHNMSYNEAFEMAHFGAKVLYPPSIKPVMENNIPLILKNTFEPNYPGTYISKKVDNSLNYVKGISSLSNISLVTVSCIGLGIKKGIAARVFNTLNKANINVILITQCSSEQSICIGIDKNDVDAASQFLNKEFAFEIEGGLMNQAVQQSKLSVIALIGDKMKQKPGLCGKACSVLGENNINIVAIAQGASERNISIVVNQLDEQKAINVLHESFFDESSKKVHLLVAGKGNVGKEFIDIISNQKEKLLQKKIELVLVGIINSSKFLLNENGLNLDCDINNGTNYSGIESIMSKFNDLNLRNSVFVDITASEQVASKYDLFLSKSVSVISCNKIAMSGDIEVYHKLHQLSKQNNCHFRYETCVGAALPIIKTIQDLILSGDEIIKIEAVLSGSLNFIFNSYNESKPFAAVVKEALEQGYTEPNPLIDLSGKDVIRKTLILAREHGLYLKENQVEFNSFLPESCLNSNEKDLFNNLQLNEAHFLSLLKAAKNINAKLRVVATIQNNSASVGLKKVTNESPLYNLEGKDNIVIINSNRYKEEPLVIKGAGAGAAITASGLFSDLMLTINS